MNMIRSKRGMSLLLGGAALALLIGMAFSSRTSDRAPEKKVSDSSSIPVAPAPPAGAGEVKTDAFVTEAEAPTKDFPALLSEVEAGIAGVSWGTPGFSALVTRLADFLEARPDAMEEAAAVIRSGDVAVAMKWALIEALGRQSDAGLAHAILTGLAADPVLSDSLKRTVVSCLSLTGNIPEETIDFLQGIASGKGFLVGLALETMARSAARLDRSRAERIVHFLEIALEARIASGDSNRTAATLRALAFSGSVSSANRVDSLTRNGCPVVRSAALVCLGKLDRAAGESQIRYSLLNDPDPRVRLGAIEALKPVPLGVAEEQAPNAGRVSAVALVDLLHVAKNDANKSVRLQALRFFEQTWRRAPGSVLDAVRIMAANDASPYVRDRAQWALDYAFES
jgi:hypothetical protein